MRLRVKSHIQQRTITVDEGTSVSDFVSLLDTFDDLKDEVQHTIRSIKFGFPPNPVDLTSDSTLAEQGIKSGDQLAVTYAAPKDKPKAATKNNSEVPSVFIHQLNRYLILRNVPDDNSCLFNAVNYAINGSQSTTSPQDLRDIIVNYVLADPTLYSEVMLGKPPQEYCRWISKRTSWGGAIELGILADWLDVQIVCLDIESGRFMHFQNENKAPKRFITLVYSGIHYDLLVLNDVLSTTDGDKLLDSTCWSTSQLDLILDAAKELCGLLQSKNFSTNTTTFRVRCLECYEILVGEMGATNHATEKGHYRFGEVESK